MPGQTKRLIDSILERRSKGNPTLFFATKTKLILKGVNPDKYTAESPDDPAMIAKVRAIAAELGVPV
jgi:hypothetical protein